jgi:DNA-binding transcriptional ArsR family regulator
VKVPFYTDEEFAAMPREARQALAGVALQAIMAEALAAFWAGRMIDDRRVWLSWRWFNVDGQGRGDLADDQARSWARAQEIEAESASRCAISGEPTKSIIVSSLGYVRSRFSSTPPATALTQPETALGTAIKLGQGERSVEDAVTYAISDRLRIEILAILNEGERTRHELAHLIGERPDKIKHHLKALLDEGSIELAQSKRVGNLMQNYYRAVRMPIYTDEEVAAMSPEARQAITGVALQGIVAEALAAFQAGTMIGDPRLWLSWRWFHVDGQGRGDLADEQARSWARAQEIEAESASRCIATNEPLKSIIVSSLGYVRSRRAPANGPSEGSDAALAGREGPWLANSIGPTRR